MFKVDCKRGLLAHLNLKPVTLLIVLLGSSLFLSTLFADSQIVSKTEVKSETKIGPKLSYFNQLEKSGLLLLDPQQKVLLSKSADRFFIPASTTKLVTALLALNHWGAAHRFKTEFYLIKESGSRQAKLMVKGFGDPFLVSEELDLISKQLADLLKDQQISHISSIQLDTSYYESGLKMPGASTSDNPYDAIPSALAANFNTLNIRKTTTGFESAESQTPMTKTALLLAKQIKSFKKTKTGLEQRVNLGFDEKLNQTYFAELLAAFLRQKGLKVSDQVAWQTINSSEPQLLYRHYNSLTLDKMIRPMMKYSTNFVANQLALNLSQSVLGGQGSAQKVALTYRQELLALFDWQGFNVEEGAGLSRKNRLTPEQLIDVLNVFKPWRHLLPEIEQGVFAKSGSLIGVSTLAGYIYMESKWYPFAFMINQKVPYRFRNKLAKELSQRY